jgi:hypothetical protein
MTENTTDEKTTNGHVYDERSLYTSTSSLFDPSGFVVRYLVGFAAAVLSLVLWYSRRTDTEFLGWKIGMVGGVVPVECVVCCVLVAWLAVEEFRRTDREILKD